jgi:hypothetical protein
VNDIKNRSRIRIGQSIMVPMAEASASYTRGSRARVEDLGEAYGEATQPTQEGASSRGTGSTWNTIRAGRLHPPELNLPIEPISIPTRSFSEG